MKLLGKYRISLSEWTYPEQDIQSLEESERFVDFLEEPNPYDGQAVEQGLEVVFVDGVRRTEYAMYLYDEEGGKSHEAVLVSLGAGAIKISLHKLNLLEPSLVSHRIKRLFAVRGLWGIPPLSCAGISFDPESFEGELSTEINRYMREQLEAEIAKEVYKKFPNTLVFCDGQLSQRLKGTYCIGIIKSIKRLYIPNEQLNILANMKKAQRSPIVKLHYQEKMEEEEKVDRYSWYVKLSDGEGLHSLVRLEVLNFDRIDLQRVKRIADISAWLLPLFASTPFKDRRSPQNLLPVSSLENTLRRLLGPYKIIRSKIREALYA